MDKPPYVPDVKEKIGASESLSPGIFFFFDDVASSGRCTKSPPSNLGTSLTSRKAVSQGADERSVSPHVEFLRGLSEERKSVRMITSIQKVMSVVA